MMNVQTAPSCLVRNRAMYRPTNVPFCLAKIGNTGNSIAMGTEEKKGEECSKRPRAKSITQPQFLTWKRQKDADASARKAEAGRKCAEGIASGMIPMNGRELFLHEPWVFDNTRY